MPLAGRSTADLKGDLLSVKMFGAQGDGIANDRDAFQEGLDYLGGKGGGYLHVPKTNSGFYLINSAITIPAGVILIGEGDGSMLKRGGTIAAGDGLIIIDGEDAGIENLKIDGDVTTIENLLYGSGTSSVLFNNDPMDSKLTANTSIWIRPGSHNFYISGVTITHTGGYAILVDVQDADTRNGAILDCFFENNRPHLFGVDAGTPANNIYGAWTGGIFVKGDCRTSASKEFAMRGLRIRGCTFHRMNGNCIWSHSYGFDTHHENFVFEQNIFRYIARDGYMIGNVVGGRAHGSMKYVGFTHATDSDAPVGAYLANNYAVGFDAAGYVSDFEFSGDVDEFYGGAFDLDGVRNSTILSPRASSTQAIAKGIQTGDTNANGGGANVRILGGHLQGCNAGSVVLNQADSCLLSGTTIDHPTGSAVTPVLLYSLDKRTKDSVVTGCVITYPDANFCVVESDNATGTGFDGTTRNFVFGNICLGANKGEFYKDANSASTTGITFSSNVATPSDKSEFFMQREGQGVSASLKGYTINSSTTKQRFQWQDYRDGSTEDTVLNISLNGAADTGIVALGDRTSFTAFSDLFAGGHMLGYGFMAILGKTAAGGVYSDTNADALTDIWALLRFDEATNTIEQSVSTSSGSRVWTPLSSGLSIGGSDTQVQFNDGGVLAGDSGLVWDKTNNVLTVTGVVSTAAIYVGTGYVHSAGGFNVPVANTATDAIQATGGGVTAKWLIATESIFGIAVAAPAVSAAGQGKLHFNSTSNKWEYSENGSSWANCFGTGSVAGANTEVQFNNSGAFGASANFTWTNASKLLTITGNTGTAGITTATCYIQSAEGFLTNDASSDAVNVPNGGVTALSLISIRNDGASGVYVTRSSATARSYGFGVNASGSLVLRDETGAANRLTMDTSGLITIGTTVAINQSGAVTISGVFTSNGASGGVNVSGSSAYNCIQASASGGMAARSFTASVYIQMGQNAGAPTATTSDTLNNGALYYDTSTNKARVRISGSFVDIATGSATVAGSDTQVQFNDGGAFGAESAFTWNKTTNVLTITGSTGTAGIVAATCYIQSAEGFYTTSTSYQGVQAPSGGVYGSSVQAVNYTQPGRRSSDPTATSGDTIADGCLYYNTSTAKLKVRISSSFVDIATGTSGVTSLSPGSKTGAVTLTSGTGITVADAGGSNISITNSGVTSLTASTGISVSAATGSVTITNTGVTSVAGTTNQVTVSASTGSVTFSLPQSIATSSSVNFGSVTCTGGVSGSSILVSGTTVIDGSFNHNGVSYKISGTTIINSSGQFVGPGALCGASGIGGGGFNPWNGGGYDTGATGTITVGSTTSITVKGGVITGWS